MRNALVEKNWINLIAALSLAVLPLFFGLAQPTASISSMNNSHSVQLAEFSAD